MTEIDIAQLLRVYLVADPAFRNSDDVLEATRKALTGGVTLVQLRAKHLTDRDLVALGRRLLELTRAFEVPLVVNDRVDVALAIGADGVHLGVNDLSPSDARRIAPRPFIVGYSPDDENDEAGRDADYLGIGPVYGTQSKADAGEALGLERFRSRVESSDVPVVGIGGINDANAGAVVQAGAAGVAVISAILGDPDPAEAARRLRRAVD